MFRAVVLFAAGLALAASVPAAAGGTPEKPGFHTRKVAIVVYPGVEALDFTGPTEVFTDAAGFGEAGGEKAFEVFLVSRSHEPVLSQGMMRVVPQYGIADCPQPDILVLPGGMSTSVTDDASWMTWVRRASAGAECVLTVCTGAYIAGECGLLDGHDVTTWYGAVERLGGKFPAARAIPGRRFIDSGRLITTAGVSAGIDGSLHLVARLVGRYVADRTAEYMEYKWAPESYLSSGYATLNPQLDARGRDLQRAEILVHDGDAEGAVATCRRLVEQDPADAEAWLGLGRALHGAKRYDDAISAHLQACKGDAQRVTALFNLACEYSLTGRADLAIDALEQAVRNGFRQRWSLERDEDLAAIRSDARFQKLLAAVSK